MILRYLATGLVTLLLPLPALSVEPFRYRGAAKDGGILAYVFEAGEQNSPETKKEGQVKKRGTVSTGKGRGKKARDQSCGGGSRRVG